MEATGIDEGDRAQICSVDQLGDVSEDRCLTLYRNMFGHGSQMGKLNLYLVENCEGSLVSSGNEMYTEYSYKTMLANFDHNGTLNLRPRDSSL